MYNFRQLVGADGYYYPWYKFSTNECYNGLRFKVVNDNVISPSGDFSLECYVKKVGVDVRVIPVTEGGCIYLIEGYRYSHKNLCSLEILSYQVLEDIDPRKGAEDGLLSNTGLRAKDYDLLSKELLLDVRLPSNEKGYIYLARNLFQECDHLTSPLVVQVLPLKTAVAMVMDGRIQDLFSITGILLCEKFLQR